MEESISGFRVRGTWGEVVEHGERVTQALRQAGAPAAYPAAFEAWNEWRPKAHERIEEEVREKTAEQASVNEGTGEKKGRTPDDDIKRAGEKLSESYEKLEDDDAEGAVERWQDSIDYVARAADTAGRKALRAVEDTVYRRVMTQIAPYYFDNELVSANVQHVRSQEEFEFEVDVNDDELREAVREHLQGFEDIDRWHVDTEKAVETAEAAEGVEVPEKQRESEAEAKSTTN